MLEEIPENYTYLSAADLSQIFIHFSENECKGLSPIYFQLCNEISKDEELLKVASYATMRQPIPNLLLAAVHFMLLKSPSYDLAKFYPSITNKPSKGIPLHRFKAFVLQNIDEVLRILSNKIVQTNAINRTAHIMPIISSLFDGADNITMVDIGTSAGLNLNFDRYEYYYKGLGRFGESDVKIKSEITGGIMPKFSAISKIAAKIGVDQNPLNVKVEENALWLMALTWPDQIARFKRLKAAINIAKQENIQFVKGETVNDFEKVITSVDAKSNLVVLHSHTIYQFSAEERTTLYEMFNRIGEKRDYYYLAVEGGSLLSGQYNNPNTVIELSQYSKGIKVTKLMGETNAHGNWIKWF